MDNNQGTAGSVAITIPKHQLIHEALIRLGAVIDRVETLANRIDPPAPQPMTADKISPEKHTEFSLSEFLNRAPDDIHSTADKLNTQVDRIQALLF